MHSHSREASFTQLWWIQGMISATLTVVEVDKPTTKGALQWALAVEYFIPFPKPHPLIYKGMWEL
jgi:hypothetical protein